MARTKQLRGGMRVQALAHRMEQRSYRRCLAAKAVPRQAAVIRAAEVKCLALMRRVPAQRNCHCRGAPPKLSAKLGSGFRFAAPIILTANKLARFAASRDNARRTNINAKRIYWTGSCVKRLATTR